MQPPQNLQNLQQVRELEQFKAIIEAIAYGYPGLVSAVGMKAPRVPITRRMDPTPLNEADLGHAVTVLRPSTSKAEDLQDIIVRFMDFLGTIKKPKYVLMGGYEYGMGVNVDIWDDDTQEMVARTVGPVVKVISPPIPQYVGMPQK
jgi:hypothetical protein